MQKVLCNNADSAKVSKGVVYFVDTLTDVDAYVYTTSRKYVGMLPSKWFTPVL